MVKETIGQSIIHTEEINNGLKRVSRMQVRVGSEISLSSAWAGDYSDELCILNNNE